MNRRTWMLSASIWSCLGVGLAALQTNPPVPLRAGSFPVFARQCGTFEDRNRVLRLTAATAPTDGEPLMFVQDPQRSGVISYDGIPSFDAASWGTVELQTDIRPKAHPAIVQPLPVDAPSFGPADWRGVVFDAAVPGRFKVGQRARLMGRVTARDRSDFDTILIRFWKFGGTDSEAVRVAQRVSSSGSFDLDVEFRDGQQGRYSMEVFLFWPNSGAQYPRSDLTPLIVE